MTGIYIIISPTDRVYVGQSTNIDKRIWAYKKESCVGQPLLHRSLKKHSWEAHKFEVVMELREDINPAMLTYWEQFFMNYYRDEGYKLLNLKEAGSRGKHSEETKEKLRSAWRVGSEKRSGKNHHFYGKNFSKEHIERLKSSHKGIQSGEKHPMFGKKHSEETKKRWSEKRRGSKLPESAIIKKSKPILQFDLNGNLIREWIGSLRASKELSFNRGSIIQCCYGKKENYKNFIWKFKNAS